MPDQAYDDAMAVFRKYGGQEPPGQKQTAPEPEKPADPYDLAMQVFKKYGGVTPPPGLPEQQPPQPAATQQVPPSVKIEAPAPPQPEVIPGGFGGQRRLPEALAPMPKGKEEPSAVVQHLSEIPEQVPIGVKKGTADVLSRWSSMVDPMSAMTGAGVFPDPETFEALRQAPKTREERLKVARQATEQAFFPEGPPPEPKTFTGMLARGAGEFVPQFAELGVMGAVAGAATAPLEMVNLAKYATNPLVQRAIGYAFPGSIRTALTFALPGATQEEPVKGALHGAGLGLLLGGLHASTGVIPNNVTRWLSRIGGAATIGGGATAMAGGGTAEIARDALLFSVFEGWGAFKEHLAERKTKDWTIDWDWMSKQLPKETVDTLREAPVDSPEFVEAMDKAGRSIYERTPEPTKPSAETAGVKELFGELPPDNVGGNNQLVARLGSRERVDRFRELHETGDVETLLREFPEQSSQATEQQKAAAITPAERAVQESAPLTISRQEAAPEPEKPAPKAEEKPPELPPQPMGTTGSVDRGVVGEVKPVSEPEKVVPAEPVSGAVAKNTINDSEWLEMAKKLVKVEENYPGMEELGQATPMGIRLQGTIQDNPSTFLHEVAHQIDASFPSKGNEFSSTVKNAIEKSNRYIQQLDPPEAVAEVYTQYKSGGKILSDIDTPEWRKVVKMMDAQLEKETARPTPAPAKEPPIVEYERLIDKGRKERTPEEEARLEELSKLYRVTGSGRIEPITTEPTIKKFSQEQREQLDKWEAEGYEVRRPDSKADAKILVSLGYRPTEIPNIFIKSPPDLAAKVGKEPRAEGGLPPGVKESLAKWGTAGKVGVPKDIVSKEARTQSAYEQGSLRGLILGKGGIRSDSEALNNLAPEEIRALKNSGIIRDKNKYPNAPGADEVFGDLRKEFPDFMYGINEESDMLREIADGSYKKRYKLSEEKIRRQEEDYYAAEIAREVERGGHSEEDVAAAERAIEREIADERAAIQSEARGELAGGLDYGWEPESRLDQLQKANPKIDPKRLELVLKTFPEGPDDKILQIAGSSKLYEQFRKQRLKLLDQAGGDADKMQTITGLGGDMFTDFFKKDPLYRLADLPLVERLNAFKESPLWKNLTPEEQRALLLDERGTEPHPALLDFIARMSQPGIMKGMDKDLALYPPDYLKRIEPLYRVLDKLGGESFLSIPEGAPHDFIERTVEALRAAMPKETTPWIVDDLKKLYPGVRIYESKMFPNVVEATFPSGIKAKIERDGTITVDPTSLKRGHGLEALGITQYAAGEFYKIDPGFMVRIASGEGLDTLAHEAVGHPVYEMFANAKERQALERKWGKLDPKKSVNENVAEGLGKEIVDRIESGNWKGAELERTIFQRMKDFFIKLLDAIHPTWKSVMRQIESGRMWERTPEGWVPEPQKGLPEALAPQAKVGERGKDNFITGIVAKKGLNEKTYLSIFKDPSSGDIATITKEMREQYGKNFMEDFYDTPGEFEIRTISKGKDRYVFSAEVLHEDALRKLTEIGLLSPGEKVTFGEGVVKNGKVSYKGSEPATAPSIPEALMPQYSVREKPTAEERRAEQEARRAAGIPNYKDFYREHLQETSELYRRLTTPGNMDVPLYEGQQFTKRAGLQIKDETGKVRFLSKKEVYEHYFDPKKDYAEGTPSVADPRIAPEGTIDPPPVQVRPEEPGKLKKIHQNWAENFSIRKVGELADRTQTSIVEHLGWASREMHKAVEVLNKYDRLFREMSQEDLMKFTDLAETGQLDKVSPELQEAAQAWRRIADSLHSLVSATKDGGLNYWEDWFPRMFKNRAQAEVAIRNALRSHGRTMTGPESMLKARTQLLLSDSIRPVEEGGLGLELAFPNYVDMMKAKVHESLRYLTGSYIKQDLLDAGFLQKAKLPGKKGIKAPPPAGWVEIQDKSLRGFYAHPEVAKALENFLSKGLRGNAIYDAVSNPISALQEMFVGLSAFHGMFTTLGNVSHGVGANLPRAIGAALTGRFGAAGSNLKDLAKSFNIVGETRRGSKIIKEYAKPGTFPELSEMVDIMTRGGMRANTTAFWDTILGTKGGAQDFSEMSRAFADVLRESKSGIPRRMMRAISWPIMNYFVPRVKANAMYRRLGLEIERFKLENDGRSPNREETTKIAQQVGREVDNIFGQMVYDNLGMKRGLRDSLKLWIGFPGWNIGSGSLLVESMKGVGHLIGQTGKMGAELFTGQKPMYEKMTQAQRTSMEFYLGMTLVTAIAGSLTMRLLTGQWPQDMKDVFMPQTGGTLANGNPERVRMPTYIRDVLSLNHPMDMMAAKENFAIRIFTELTRNQDYFGTQIRDPWATPKEQALQLAEFGGKSFLPFGVQGMLKSETPQAKALNLIGITPVPRRYSNTPAQNVIDEYNQMMRATTTTKETAELKKLKSDLMKLARDQDESGFQAAASEAVSEGKITRAQVKEIVGESQVPPGLTRFYRLPIEWMARAMDAASDYEQEKFAPLMLKKIAQAKPEVLIKNREALVPLLQKMGMDEVADRISNLTMPEEPLTGIDLMGLGVPGEQPEGGGMAAVDAAVAQLIDKNMAKIAVPGKAKKRSNKFSPLGI